MAALQCEICGGKLIGKPGGVFECDSCGMEYSTEWAKAKVQEIKGTVKIEGPVEVTGTVKVEGGASVESLLKRGKVLLSDWYCEEARKLFEQVLNLDSECAEAYLGLTMSIHQISTLSDLEEKYIENPGLYDRDKNFQRAQRFANLELKAALDKIKNARRNHDEQERQRRTKMIPVYAKRREQLSQAAKMLGAGYEHIVALKSNGTVVIIECSEFRLGYRDDAKTYIVPGWRDIVAVAAGDTCSVGLRADGTVSVIGSISNPIGNSDLQSMVLDWRNIVAVSAGYDYVVGLRTDGTVVAAGNNEYGQCDVQGWSNIMAVSAGNTHTVGLKENGTVVAAGSNTSGECNVQDWSNVVMVGAGDSYTMALKADGTVIATEEIGYFSTDDLACWSDIVAISAGSSHVIGLELDGTVRTCGSDYHGQRAIGGSDDVVAIAAGRKITAVLRADGGIWRTKIVRKRFDSGNTSVSNLKLFKSFESLEQERNQIRTEVRNLEAQRIALQTELTSLKGLFSGSKRRELEAKLVQIEKELNTL